MSIHEVVQYETPEASSENFRSACARYVIEIFTPVIYPTLGQGTNVEDRYLPKEDTYYDRLQPDSPWYTPLRSKKLDESYERLVAQYRANPSSLTTNEELQKLADAANNARVSFGQQLLAKALELKLVRTLDPKEAKVLANLHQHVNLSKYCRDRHLFTSGWEIFAPSDPNKGPILLAPVNPEHPEEGFNVVQLDELHQIAPNFLPTQILSFYEAEVMAQLANSIRHDIALQSTPENRILPPFLTELEKITDENEKQEVRDHMKQYLTVVALSQPDRLTTFIIDQLKKTIIINESLITNIQGYLNRRKNHPEQPANTQQRAASMLKTLNTFMAIDPNNNDYSRQVSRLTETTSPTTLPILRNPANYLYSDQEGAEILAKQELKRRVTEFYSAITEVTDLNQIEALLQQLLPEFHETLENFKQWLGSDHQGNSHYETFIKTVAQSAESNHSILHRSLPESIDQAIKLALKQHLLQPGKPPFGSLYMPNFNDFRLYNPHLEMILPVIVIKTIQLSLQNQKTQRIYQRTEYLDALTESFRQQEPTLQQAYMQKHLPDDDVLAQRLQQIQRHRMSFDEFARTSNINMREIATLKTISTEVDRSDRHILNGETFSTMLNLLYFQKTTPQAINSIRTAAFQELLKALYPHIPDDKWAEYWYLVDSP